MTNEEKQEGLRRFTDDTTAPFLVDAGGRRWTVATDNRVLLSFRGELAGAAVGPLSEKAGLLMAATLEKLSAPLIDLARLRYFCGAPEWQHNLYCDTCTETTTWYPSQRLGYIGEPFDHSMSVNKGRG